jgi:hypothetical protein
MRAGQALERDAFAGHVEPVVEVRVVRDQLLHLGVRAGDVLRVARERSPAEGPDAAAEEGADIGRHEARERERVLHAHVLRHLADVVAVIEHRHARAPEIEHGFHLDGHGALGGFHRALRIAGAALVPFGEGPARGQVAVEGIVGGGLVRDGIGPHAPAHEFGEDLGRIAEKADGNRLPLAARALDHGERLVEGAGLRVEVAGAQAHLDALRRALDREHGGARHGGGEGLCAAHAAETSGEEPAALEVAAVMAAPTSAKVS